MWFNYLLAGSGFVGLLLCYRCLRWSYTDDPHNTLREIVNYIGSLNYGDEPPPLVDSSSEDVFEFPPIPEEGDSSDGDGTWLPPNLPRGFLHQEHPGINAEYEAVYKQWVAHIHTAIPRHHAGTMRYKGKPTSLGSNGKGKAKAKGTAIRRRADTLLDPGSYGNLAGHSWTGTNR